jgi:hypothetical protein
MRNAALNDRVTWGGCNQSMDPNAADRLQALSWSRSLSTIDRHVKCAPAALS